MRLINIHRPGSHHQAADAMYRLATTGNDQLTINVDIPKIFVAPVYEPTNQKHAEYLYDTTDLSCAVDAPSNLIKITDQMDETAKQEQRIFTKM